MEQNDVIKAGMKHFQGTDSIVPNCACVVIDTDIHFLIYGVTLHAGAYFIPQIESSDGSMTTRMYILDLDLERLKVLADNAGAEDSPLECVVETDDDGNQIRKLSVKHGENAISFDAELRPVYLDSKNEKPLTLEEAVTWAAIGDAESEEVISEIISVMYKVTPGKVTKDTAVAPAKQDTNAVRQQHEPITKLASIITDLPVDGLNHGVDVTGATERRRGKKVVTAVSLNYEDEDVSITRHLTNFDREVSNAVTANFVAGNHVITARQVCQTMTGRAGMPSKSMLQKTDKSIQRLMRTWAVVDYTQEARGRELEMDGQPVTSCKISGHLLEGKIAEIETANGSTIRGYEFNGTPILYQHATAINQVITYPQSLLSTAEAGSDTEQNTLIKHYLLRRIGQMKHSSKSKRKIRYKTVYENCGIESPSRKKQKSVNDYIIALLEVWKSDGYIKGFRECHEGRGGKRTSVEIKI